LLGALRKLSSFELLLRNQKANVTQKERKTAWMLGRYIVTEFKPIERDYAEKPVSVSKPATALCTTQLFSGPLSIFFFSLFINMFDFFIPYLSKINALPRYVSALRLRLNSSHRNVVTPTFVTPFTPPF
jgi:hypothetical protein